MICLPFPGLFGPCTNDVFTAYAHVRTEPQCDIGHTRGKKRELGISSPTPSIEGLHFAQPALRLKADESQAYMLLYKALNGLRGISATRRW